MNAVLEPPLPRHRFSRAEYDRMVEAGIFGEDDRIELLDGEIIDMAPQKSRHATAVQLVQEALRRAFGAGYCVRVQLPLCLDDRSEPETDVAIVAGTPRDYRDAHPTTAILVAEVADASLAYDRIRKLAAYARSGIPEYWILDLSSGTLEVCRFPERDTYLERRALGAGDSVLLRGPEGISVAVADLLP